jgi:dTDP-4-amino-4,6-dideoxygalactose transaminase
MTNFGIGFNQSTKGTNAKLSEYHAAIGLAHLDVWPSQIKKRNTLLAIYKDCLPKGDAGPVRLQKDDGLFAPSVFNVRVENSAIRNRLEASFERQHIQTRRWYLPLLQNQPILKDLEKVTSTPISDELSETLIGLPFFIDMTHEQVSKICVLLPK